MARSTGGEVMDVPDEIIAKLFPLGKVPTTEVEWGEWLDGMVYRNRRLRERLDKAEVALLTAFMAMGAQAGRNKAGLDDEAKAMMVAVLGWPE